MKFKVAQLVHANRNLTMVDDLSGELVTIPQGTPATVGADGMVHLFDYAIDKEIEGDVVGFDRKGFGIYMSEHLYREIGEDYKQLMDKYDMEKIIARGCEEIGL